MNTLAKKLIRLGSTHKELRLDLTPIIDYLTKQSSQIVMYHGTSSKFLKSILSQGLIPNPTERRWGEDMEAFRKSVQPVSSLEGYVYLTRDKWNGIEIARDAATKFGENPLLIVVQVSPNTLSLDHDNLTLPVEEAVVSLARKYAPPGTKSPESWLLGWMMGVDTSERISIGEEFGAILAQSIDGDPGVLKHKHGESDSTGISQHIPAKLLLMYLEMVNKKAKGSGLTLGYIAAQYDYWEAMGYDTGLPPKGEPFNEDHRGMLKKDIASTSRQWPRNLSSSELDDAWKDTIKAISFRLRHTLGLADPKLRNAMIEGSITYRGSNKIISIIELDGPDQIIHYE